MKIISFIEHEKVIKNILKHLDLLEKKAGSPPKTTGWSKIPEYRIDYSPSQLHVSDKWLCVDQEYPEGYLLGGFIIFVLDPGWF